MELDCGIEQTEENHLCFNIPNFSNKDYAAMVDGKIYIFEYQEPKILQECNFSPTKGPDSCDIEEFDISKVKVEVIPLEEVTDIKKEVTEYMQDRIETELLNTHCDLPTLKTEDIDDYMDEQPCSNRQINRITKPITNTVPQISKNKERRYPSRREKAVDFKDQTINLPSPTNKILKLKAKNNRKKHYCFYCGLPTSNFARHLQRLHEDELPVQNFLKLPKLDKRRKEMLKELRKKWYSLGKNKEFANNDTICSENSQLSEAELSRSDNEPDITDNSLIANHSGSSYMETSLIKAQDSSEDGTVEDIVDNISVDDVITAQTNSLDDAKEPVNSNSPLTEVAKVVDLEDKNNLSSPPKRKLGSKKIIRRVHNCLYCDLPVNNYARHLERQHFYELEVQNFLKLPTLDKRRKEIIETLRKKGDFCSGKIVPVQNRKTTNKGPCNRLPCIFCSGYYSRNFLRRHIKRCSLNKNKNGSNNRHQYVAHTYMSSDFKLKDILRTSGVLDTLKPDEISLVAKRDKIICEMGRNYIKSHRDSLVTAVPKRLMRRLARLLIEIRNIEQNDSLTMADILHPSKLKTIVQALKTVSEYDEVRKTFKHPSLALQMGDLLKKALRAACQLEIKINKHSPLLKVFGSMTKLINDEWDLEVTTEEDKKLNVDSCNKPSVIPLIEDLQKMRIYLDDLISNAKIKLQENNKNESAYRTLIDGTYCNLFLFNKRSLNSLQRITIDTYATHLSSTSVKFEKLLSSSEIMLSNKLQGIMIKIKGEREFPVLIDRSTQDGIDLALEHRSNFFDKLNPYIFGSSHTEGPIRGYQTLRKHVKIALNDLDKMPSLTSRKLRNHLSTITQIIKMDTDDLEKLASFIGHTSETHNDWYRLSFDAYQIAKVSKILILSQKTGIEKYKGQELNDIQLDESVIETHFGGDEEEDINTESENIKKKEKIRKITWTKQEKQLTENHFRKHIREKIAPKRHEVDEFMDLYPEIFSKRKWDGIKVYVCNQYNKKQVSPNYSLRTSPIARKNLNEIQLHQTALDSQSDSFDKQEDVTIESENNNVSGIAINEQGLALNAKKRVKEKIKKISWTKEEKKLTEIYFKNHIRKSIAPKKDEVQKFMDLHPEIFAKRKWDGIKVYVCNQYNKKRIWN